MISKELIISYIKEYNLINEDKLIPIHPISDVSYDGDIAIWCHSPKVKDVTIKTELYTASNPATKEIIEDMVVGLNFVVINITKADLLKHERLLKLKQMYE